jgi:acyl carrier protein
MTKAEFLRELEKSLEREEGSIQPGASLDEIGWDSLGELAFLALANDKLGARVSASKVSACGSVDELLALLGPALS